MKSSAPLSHMRMLDMSLVLKRFDWSKLLFLHCEFIHVWIQMSFRSPNAIQETNEVLSFFLFHVPLSCWQHLNRWVFISLLLIHFWKKTTKKPPNGLYLCSKYYRGLKVKLMAGLEPGGWDAGQMLEKCSIWFLCNTHFNILPKMFWKVVDAKFSSKDAEQGKSSQWISLIILTWCVINQIIKYEGV